MQPVYRKSQVPAGRSGRWRVEKFEVPEPRQPDRRPHWCRSPGGTYTRLLRDHEVYMTDLREEWWTQRRAIREGIERGGRVLITGLGLGLVVESILEHPGTRAEHVTVVERSPDVIRLVEPHLRGRLGRRLTVVEADALTWEPPVRARYGVAWHDIWPNPHDDAVLPEERRLEERYRPFCDWQGSWVTHYREDERAAATAARPV